MTTFKRQCASEKEREREEIKRERKKERERERERKKERKKERERERERESSRNFSSAVNASAPVREVLAETSCRENNKSGTLKCCLVTSSVVAIIYFRTLAGNMRNKMNKFYSKLFAVLLLKLIGEFNLKSISRSYHPMYDFTHGTLDSMNKKLPICKIFCV